jgi:hypothetical protein
MQFIRLGGDLSGQRIVADGDGIRERTRTDAEGAFDDARFDGGCLA